MGYFSDRDLERRYGRPHADRDLLPLTPPADYYDPDPRDEDGDYRTGPDDGPTVEWVREPLKPGETEQDLPI